MKDATAIIQEIKTARLTKKNIQISVPKWMTGFCNSDGPEDWTDYNLADNLTAEISAKVLLSKEDNGSADLFKQEILIVKQQGKILYKKNNHDEIWLKINFCEDV